MARDPWEPADRRAEDEPARRDPRRAAPAPRCCGRTAAASRSPASLLVAQTACLLAGPALVRLRHRRRTARRATPARSTSPRSPYLGVAVVGLVLGRLGHPDGRRASARRSCATCAQRVPAPACRSSLDFFEREKTGRLVSRMTVRHRRAPGARADGPGHVRAERPASSSARCIVIFLLSWQLALFTLARRAAGRDRERLVPARVEQGLPQRARPHRREPRRPRRPRRRARRAGVRPRARRSPAASTSTNEAQYDANLETVRISARLLPVVEFASVAGIGGHRRRRRLVRRRRRRDGRAPSPRSCSTSTTCSSRSSSSASSTTRCSQRARRCRSCSACSTPGRRSRSGPARSTSRRPGRDRASSTCRSATARRTPVLHDVSLTIAPGERLALVGPTGAGKSTLAKLIARFYDPREGAVRFGGVDLRDATLRSLRQRIVVVPQEGFLFAGTVRDNVRVGQGRRDRRRGRRPPSTRSASRALRRASPTGSTPRSASAAPGCRRGSASSCRWRGPRSPTRRCSCSTRRRRTSIPAPSGWSSGRSTRLIEGRTVVVVAHRLSTAARADRVAVVDGGRAGGARHARGTHRPGGRVRRPLRRVGLPRRGGHGQGLLAAGVPERADARDHGGNIPTTHGVPGPFAFQANTETTLASQSLHLASRAFGPTWVQRVIRKGGFPYWVTML